MEEKELHLITISEYANRLVNEMPRLLENVGIRSRKLQTLPIERIVEGVIAHSGALPALKLALKDYENAKPDIKLNRS